MKPPVVGLVEGAAALAIEPVTLRKAAYEDLPLARRLGIFKVGRDWLIDRARLAMEVARRRGEEAPFFDPAEDADEPTAAQWAGLLVLHGEAVHGCEHTAQVRQSIGMFGPLGERAEIATGQR